MTGLCVHCCRKFREVWQLFHRWECQMWWGPVASLCLGTNTWWFNPTYSQFVAGNVQCLWPLTVEKNHRWGRHLWRMHSLLCPPRILFIHRLKHSSRTLFHYFHLRAWIAHLLQSDSCEESKLTLLIELHPKIAQWWNFIKGYCNKWNFSSQI